MNVEKNRVLVVGFLQGTWGSRFIPSFQVWAHGLIRRSEHGVTRETFTKWEKLFMVIWGRGKLINPHVMDATCKGSVGLMSKPICKAKGSDSKTRHPKRRQPARQS